MQLEGIHQREEKMKTPTFLCWELHNKIPIALFPIKKVELILICLYLEFL